MRILVECYESLGSDYYRFTYSERRIPAAMGLILHKMGYEVNYWSPHDNIDSVGIQHISEPNIINYDLIIFQDPNRWEQVKEGKRIWFHHFCVDGYMQKQGEFTDRIELFLLPHLGAYPDAEIRFPWLNGKIDWWIPPVPPVPGTSKTSYSYLYPSGAENYLVNRQTPNCLGTDSTDVFIEIARVLYQENPRSRFFMSRGLFFLCSDLDDIQQQEWLQRLTARASELKNIEMSSQLDYDYYLERVAQSEMMLMVRDYGPTGPGFVLLEGVALGCAVVCKGIPYLDDEWIIKLDTALYNFHVPGNKELLIAQCVGKIHEFYDSDKHWLIEAQEAVREKYSEEAAMKRFERWL